MAGNDARQLVRITRLDLAGAIESAESIWKQPESAEYEFDFGGLQWVEPFGMLFFASRLRSFRTQHQSCRFRAVNFESHSYAAHMGFFQSFGLRHGKDPGEAQGSSQYVPITCLTVPDVQKEAASAKEDFRETLERHSIRLASILTRNERGDLQNTLSYALREIFRNVCEHSRADAIWYAAQYWPNKELVELAILDEGIGIKNSLIRNPHLQVRDDHDALQLSLLPGVSGIAFKGGPRLRNDAWANSGYGLFMTSQLCAQGGSFFVCSGSVGLRLESEKQEATNLTFPGTALRLEIGVRSVRELAKALSEIRKNGTKIASSLNHTANLTASMSSRMLLTGKGE